MYCRQTHEKFQTGFLGDGIVDEFCVLDKTRARRLCHESTCELLTAFHRRDLDGSVQQRDYQCIHTSTDSQQKSELAVANLFQNTEKDLIRKVEQIHTPCGHDDESNQVDEGVEDGGGEREEKDRLRKARTRCCTIGTATALSERKCDLKSAQICHLMMLGKVLTTMTWYGTGQGSCFGKLFMKLTSVRVIRKK